MADILSLVTWLLLLIKTFSLFRKTGLPIADMCQRFVLIKVSGSLMPDASTQYCSLFKNGFLTLGYSLLTRKSDHSEPKGQITQPTREKPYRYDWFIGRLWINIYKNISTVFH